MKTRLFNFAQNFINHFYRYPKSNYHRLKRFGGYVAYWKMLYGKKQMENASLSLPPVQSFTDGLPIYFLTGQKYLYQTLFCIASIKRYTTEHFNFILVDDGTFDERLIIQIAHQLPGCQIVLQKEIERILEDKLPSHRFPYLNQKRKIYPHLKKLTDIHTLSGGNFKLVLDSDMLFWNYPDEIISWLKNPSGCLYMLDSDNSYGYTRGLMEDLAGVVIPDLVNVGVIGIESSTIDWEQLELWCKTLEDIEGSSYFLEQALSAMIIANQQKTILSKKDYVVNPKLGSEASVKLFHYVDLSKKQYFEHDWRRSII